MSTHYKTKFGIETLGNPKSHFGAAQKFYLLYKYRRVRCRNGLFFPLQFLRVIVRRTTSFAIKSYNFFYWRKFGGLFQMLCCGLVECELFHFQLMSINYEIILTHCISAYVMNVL